MLTGDLVQNCGASPLARLPMGAAEPSAPGVSLGGAPGAEVESACVWSWTTAEDGTKAIEILLPTYLSTDAADSLRQMRDRAVDQASVVRIHSAASERTSIHATHTLLACKVMADRRGAAFTLVAPSATLVEALKGLIATTTEAHVDPTAAVARA